MEIACDESGSEGEKLVGGVTAVFAHAGVRLSHEEAATCVRSLREMIKSPAVEYKANHLLRALGPRGALDPLFPAILRAVARCRWCTTSSCR